MLRVDNLTFSYGSHKVLSGVSFHADTNSIISILGPNGVGKTTLLKCICNIHRPQGGTILVGGTELTRLSRGEMAKYIGYVPQHANPTRTTVVDSVLIGRKPHIGWAPTRRDMELTWDAIESLGLGHLSMRYVDEISGGEFQKVQVARALVQQPKVLILDEPTNNLDLSNQHRTMRMINGVVKEHDVCTLMTMHDVNLAVCYSDSFMFIAEGKLYAYGGKEIITSDLIYNVYGIDTDVVMHGDNPFVLPNL